jgi:hypothetical protein
MYDYDYDYDYKYEDSEIDYYEMEQDEKDLEGYAEDLENWQEWETEDYTNIYDEGKDIWNQNVGDGALAMQLASAVPFIVLANTLF